MKKVVFVCMALLMALVGTGVAYAMWSDNIQIAGTVDTGSVDFEVEALSGTEVYKDLDTDEMVYSHWAINFPDPEKYYWDDGICDPPPTNGLLVASVETSQDLVADPSGDTIVFAFKNIFPLEDRIQPLGWGNWISDCRIHYVGSVPVHVKVTPTVVGIPEDWVVITFLDMATYQKYTPEEFDGIQLHYCDKFEVWIQVFVPQLDSAMNQSGSISLAVEGIQWNEYP